MPEDQETTATADATAEKAETQESPAASEAGGSKEAETQAQGKLEYAAPEGFEIDDAMRSDLDGLFRDVNVDQATAQKMVDKHFDILNKHKSNYEDKMEVQRQEWATSARTDNEFGGSNLAENLAGARKAMNSFSQPAADKDGKPILHSDGPMKGQQMTEVEALMAESGWGNHPAMIRVFYRINQAMSEDSFVQGDMKPVERKKTHADIMYGESHNK